VCPTPQQHRLTQRLGQVAHRLVDSSVDPQFPDQRLSSVLPSRDAKPVTTSFDPGGVLRRSTHPHTLWSQESLVPTAASRQSWTVVLPQPCPGPVRTFRWTFLFLERHKRHAHTNPAVAIGPGAGDAVTVVYAKGPTPHYQPFFRTMVR